MYKRILACLFLLLMAAACSPFDTATPTPSPTAVPTAAPTAVPTVADTAVPTGLPTDTAIAVTDTPQAIPTSAGEATPSAAEAASPTAEATPPTAAPTLLAAATVKPATQQQVAKIEQETASLRELKPKAAVPDHFISQAQMQSSLTKQIADEYSHADAKRDARDLWYLRLDDSPSLDLYQLQVDLLGEQVIGYYDPDKKELFVLNTQQPLDPEAVSILSHEYTHSLQDQYFDLNKVRPKHLQDNDRSQAITSLIEGDAVLEQSLFAQQYMSAADLLSLMGSSSAHPNPVLDKAPAYIRDGLIFPYEKGEQFVLTLYQNGGYAAVNKAFTDPPTTTAQILHPEKYLANPRETALPVNLPPLTSTLGSGWTQQSSDTLGEFDLNSILTTNGVARPAATAGWGGARYALYANGASVVMLMESRWDRLADVNEFDAAMQDSLSKAARTGSLWTTKGRTIGLKQQGDAVYYVAGSDATVVNRVLAAIK